VFSDCISDMGFLQRVDVAAGVVVLRLDRPERLNALDSALLFELVEALEHLSVDEELRVVVFSTTSVRALCSGVDVKEELDDAGGVARMKLLSQFLAALEAFAVPTIAVCVGNCIGAGAEIVAGCDLRIGGDNLKLAWTGARLGVPVGPARLTPLVGVARAKELIFTGARSAPRRRRRSACCTRRWRPRKQSQLRCGWPRTLPRTRLRAWRS
jgi:enoyl-CoA hydratase